MDNATSHLPLIAELNPNLKFIFLLPIAMSLLQPLDQGVIATFKMYDLNRTFWMLTSASEGGKWWNWHRILEDISTITLQPLCRMYPNNTFFRFVSGESIQFMIFKFLNPSDTCQKSLPTVFIYRSRLVLRKLNMSLRKLNMSKKLQMLRA